ncbi:unnamed protein product [Linum tenue]|uniref:Uncharacterized protein n=1 Tax=Linum tenue TaxID=586396 RepID=A0AAV0MG10_9ROSI|nr:unnamed protein product [Linum tenue]
MGKPLNGCNLARPTLDEMRRWRVIKPLFPTIHTAIVDSLENRLLHKISDHERSGSEGGVLPALVWGDFTAALCGRFGWYIDPADQTAATGMEHYKASMEDHAPVSIIGTVENDLSSAITEKTTTQRIWRRIQGLKLRYAHRYWRQTENTIASLELGRSTLTDETWEVIQQERPAWLPNSELGQQEYCFNVTKLGRTIGSM